MNYEINLSYLGTHYIFFCFKQTKLKLVFRKCCDEILAFQQRNQTLTHELQKLRSQSTYFRKKVADLEQQRASANKFKLEVI